jgi:hypothetical protein
MATAQETRVAMHLPLFFFGWTSLGLPGALDLLMGLLMSDEHLRMAPVADSILGLRQRQPQ